MALVWAGGGGAGENFELEAWDSWMGGKGSGEGSRFCTRGLAFALVGVANGLELESLFTTADSFCFPLIF